MNISTETIILVYSIYQWKPRANTRQIDLKMPQPCWESSCLVNHLMKKENIPMVDIVKQQEHSPIYEAFVAILEILIP